MLAFALSAVAVATLLALAACGGPPWTISHTPDAITLRWYADETDSATAGAAAQAHCRSSGKKAELVSSTQDGSAQLATYRCR